MILLHHHIYKNAGTTLDWILRRNFGSRFVELNATSPDSVISSDYLARYLEGNPSALAISSHNLRSFSAPADCQRYKTIVVIRHPIDRIASIYEFERRQHVGDSRFDTMKSYVRWGLDNNDRHLVDPQTSMLANDTFPPDPANSAHARAILADIPHLGVVDRFLDSVLCMEIKIREEFPWFDGAFRSQNASRPTSTPLDERVNFIRDQLGTELFEAVSWQNRYDILLHQEATRLLDARVSAIGDLQQKRDDLSRRCSIL